MAQPPPPQQQLHQQQQQQQHHHQPYQMQARPFSPSQPMMSPGAQQGYQFQQAKRQKLSPDPRSQPTSPYSQSPYGPSPTSTTPQSSLGVSPHYANIALPQQNTYSTPYANGNGSTTPTINPPNPPPLNNMSSAPTQNYHPPSAPLNGLHNSHIPPQNLYPHPTNLPPNNHFQPNYNTNMAPHGTGMMGPPSKPVEKEAANDDQMDVLANAGVDLRAEENFAMSFHTGSFGSQPTFSRPGMNTIGHGFTQFTPADSSSFYGAGPASQLGTPTDKESQDQLMKRSAEVAWAEAAHRLAVSRQHELNRPHVNVGAVWIKMDRIAKENGLVLNTDGGKMPKFKLPSEFPVEVNVQAIPTPDGAMAVTTGGFLPKETALADQLALMSLATNQRIRILLEETVALVKGRRTGSHGVVPGDWVDVAAPTTNSTGTVVAEDAPRNGWESAVSPLTKPLNSSIQAANRLPTPVSDGNKTPTTKATYTNELVKTLREAANTERAFEEARIAKRQGRPVDGILRTGSVVPGTPGSVAPEPSAKPLTKKEREKQDKGKQSVADSHAQANATTATFLGGKKKNKYSWMDAGAGSGAGTPSRINTQGLPGTPGGSIGGMVEKQRLTADGKNRMGSLREDKEGGRLIQMRDLIAVLESDGHERKALQSAYAWLDTPKPKPTQA